MDKEILKYIKKNHVGTIAMRDGEDIWCSNFFYTFDPIGVQLIFLSNLDTKHSALLMINPKVAGTISGQPKSIINIKGVQFKGVASIKEDKEYRKMFMMRFPYAVSSTATLWSIKLMYIKYTYNAVIFGKKLYWERKEK